MGVNSKVDMTRRKSKPDLSKVPSNRAVALMLADTSWRVALPIIILSMIGHNFDLRWHTSPRYLLIGFFVSIPVAILLVYRQLVVVFPDQFGKDKQKPNSENKKGDKK